MSNLSCFFNPHSFSSLVQSFSVTNSSYFLFRDGATIDPGNSLKDRSFNKLTVFGDSLSDLGNLSTATASFGITFPPSPFAQTGSIKQFTGYFGNVIQAAGRLTNGDLWVDYFAPRVGLQQKVEDFAVIGSTSGRDNVVRGTAAELGIALPEDLLLPGVLDQIDQAFKPDIPDQKADSNALYVVWGGATDFLALLPNLSPASTVNAIVDGVANVAQAVTTLANRGAKTIVVPNLPNLGLTPFADRQNSAKADLVGIATVFSVGFNLLLQPTLATLEQQLKQVDSKVDVVQIDAFSLSQDIARSPEQFGFKNSTETLFSKLQLDPPDPLLNPDEFVFADPFHPTTRTHEVFADLFEQSLSYPVASRVLETSVSAINDLIRTGRGQSVINDLLKIAQSSIVGQSSLFPQVLEPLLRSNLAVAYSQTV